MGSGVARSPQGLLECREGPLEAGFGRWQEAYEDFIECGRRGSRYSERSRNHSLRRTCASVPYALGETPPVVMAEMGHTDPKLALAIYAQAMRRRRVNSRRCAHSWRERRHLGFAK